MLALLLLWLLIPGLTSSLTFQRSTFKTSSDRDAALLLLAETVNASRALLRAPSILDPFTTARKHLDTEQMGQDDRIIVGVLVENYSRYRLADPRTSKTTCTYNREINEPLPVDPGSAELFAVDNQGYRHRGVCGTFSWQILREDGRAAATKDAPSVGRRLVVTYHVPFAGSCGPDGRTNSFSLNIWHAHLNASDHWTRPELVETFYSTDHARDSAASFSDDGAEALAPFDEGRFLLHGIMERGCKPLLTVRFAVGAGNVGMRWAKEEGKSGGQKWVGEAKFGDPPEGKKDEEAPSYFSLPWILSLSLGVSLSFIAVILSVSAYSGLRRRRGQHRSAPI